jgi:hypothetical protein
MEAAERPHDDVLYVGALEIRPSDGLVLAGGRALNLSVREFGLLVALARSGGGIVRREDLYARVWGGALRGGDRSIDVYIHKLRVKLEEALPDWRSSTRTWGSATDSRPSLHTLFTSPRRVGNRLCASALRACGPAEGPNQRSTCEYEQVARRGGGDVARIRRSRLRQR